MKTVLILRHAKSSWNDPLLSDHDRPLNKRGKRDAPYIGEFLKHQQLVPDLILSSTAKRARKTAQAVAKASGYDGEVEMITSFYHAEPETYISRLEDLPDTYQRVMVVGHNPTLEMLVTQLTNCFETMPTAAVAYVQLPIENWRKLADSTAAGSMQGQLLQLWRPKELVLDQSTSLC